MTIRAPKKSDLEENAEDFEEMDETSSPAIRDIRDSDGMLIRNRFPRLILDTRKFRRKDPDGFRRESMVIN